jgi:hypothetical protein
MSRAALAEVARLYYVRELTQQQIAQRLGVSRFKVLRLLEQARAEGVVRFEIEEPVPVIDELAERLEERYAVTAIVVERDIAGAAAALLPRLVGKDDVLGVAWGETLAAIAARLPEFEHPVPVVQVCGAIDGLRPGTGPTELAASFAAPGARDRICHHGVGDIPGEQLLGFRTADYALHAWDLARAIGGDEQLDDALVEELWLVMSPMAPMIGGSGQFGTGPSGDLDADAPLQARLLDLSGRRPAP